MSLSKRADDTQELQIKETFSKVVSENNLFIIGNTKSTRFIPYNTDKQ